MPPVFGSPSFLVFLPILWTMRNSFGHALLEQTDSSSPPLKRRRCGRDLRPIFHTHFATRILQSTGFRKFTCSPFTIPLIPGVRLRVINSEVFIIFTLLLTSFRTFTGFPLGPISPGLLLHLLPLISPSAWAYPPPITRRSQSSSSQQKKKRVGGGRRL